MSKRRATSNCKQSDRVFNGLILLTDRNVSLLHSRKRFLVFSSVWNRARVSEAKEWRSSCFDYNFF